MKKRIQHLLPALLALYMVFSLYGLLAMAAEATPAETGTESSPWDISAETGTDSVSAWYEGNAESGYTLIISGEGRMTDSYRSATPPWASNDTPDNSPTPVPSDNPVGSPAPAPSDIPVGSPVPAPSDNPVGSPAPSYIPANSQTPNPSDAGTATPSPIPSETDSDATPSGQRK